jgi:2-oxoglutarate dehydrogenase E1 component
LLDTDRHPLVLMTPKSLLRNPLAASTLEDLAIGTFQPVLDDPLRTQQPDKVTRLVLCSGKIGVELDASEVRAAAESVAVARVEQLAPFQNSALRALFDHYPNLDEIVWAQEEPKNMGAWSYMEPRLRDLLGQLERLLPIRYVGRPERASPAEGYLDRHMAEQARIVAEAFGAVGETMLAGGAGALVAAGGNGAQRDGRHGPGANGATASQARAAKTRASRR